MPAGAAVRPPMLSKTRYVAGQQCHLRLWNDQHQRDLAEPVSASLKAIFDQGHAVGELATRRFPGGVLVREESWPIEEACARTAALMADPRVPAIFEAAFVHGGTLVRVDILERAAGGRWNLIEVKSTGSVKRVHVQDAALQAWVVRGAGVKLGSVAVCTLNTAYVYDGTKLDLEQLFTLHDVSEQARELGATVSDNVPILLRVLGQDEPPAIEPGPHCSEPYDCPYLAHCTRNLVPVSHPIIELPKLSPRKAAWLTEHDIESIHDLHLAPEELELTPLQERVRDSVTRGVEFIAPELRAALEKPEHPIFYLDFETVGSAIPRYAGTRPFQFVPFQWSMHIEEADGTLGHEEFSSDSDTDPRAALAEALLAAVGSQGSICSYSSYESTVIRGLAAALPQYRARLTALLPRLWDLLLVVRQHYYHPDFHGSFSIKGVLPALVPGASYDDLSVSDGMQAGIAYLEAITTEDAARKAELLAALRAYCQRDSLGMVEVRRALLERSADA
jgi:hypothetical protein